MARIALFLISLVAIAYFASADRCSTYTSSCQTCTNGYSNDGRLHCQWCTASNECVSAATTCSIPSSLRIASSYSCPRTTTPSYTRPSPPPVAPSCTAYDCSSCIAQSSCGWCESLRRCMYGTASGSRMQYAVCPSSGSNWRWSSCGVVPVYRNTGHKSMVTIFVIIGIFAIAAGSIFTLICLRRRRQLASDDFTSFELGSTEDFPIEDAPTSPPAFGNALPGYLYTTSSTDSSAPQYVYTAVPVGPVVSHIPQ